MLLHYAMRVTPSRRLARYRGWREDGYRALGKVFSRARADAMGELDMSRNPALSVMQQLSVSYDEPPEITRTIGAIGSGAS